MPTLTLHRPESKQPRLTPVLGPQTALKPKHVLACVVFATLLLYLNHLPIWHAEIWGDVATGQQIIQRGALPTEYSNLPLADGMRVIDSAWGSQVLHASTQRWGGSEWLSNLFAATLLTTYLLLARAYYLQSRSLGVAMAGVALALVVGWTQLAFAWSKMFGLLCFSALWWLIVRNASRPKSRAFAWEIWIGVPLVMLVWVNLHQSFFWGLVVLGCFTAGDLAGVAWSGTREQRMLAGLGFRRWLMVTELGALATLVNPYGLDVWFYALETTGIVGAVASRHVPLMLFSGPGLCFALGWLAIVAVLRHSKRPMAVRDVLLLAVFSFATAADATTQIWLAPVIALAIVPHLRGLADRFVAPRIELRRQGSAVEAEGEAPANWKYSMICVFIVWMTFAFSGLSRPVLGGTPRSGERLYSRDTPRGVSAYLLEHAPKGQVWNPAEWGDWLAWDGPATLQLFTSSHSRVIPDRVWRDYLHVYHARPGWEQTLDRYRVTTVIVDKAQQPALAGVLRENNGWAVRYEDLLGIVFVRAGASNV